MATTDPRTEPPCIPLFLSLPFCHGICPPLFFPADARSLLLSLNLLVAPSPFVFFVFRTACRRGYVGYPLFLFLPFSIPLIRCYDACTADSTSTERLNEKSDVYSLAKNLPAIHAPMKYFLSPSFPVVRWKNVRFFHRGLSPSPVPVVCAHSCAAAPPFLYFTFYGYTLTRDDAQIGGMIRPLRSFVVLAFALCA